MHYTELNALAQDQAAARDRPERPTHPAPRPWRRGLALLRLGGRPAPVPARPAEALASQTVAGAPVCDGRAV